MKISSTKKAAILATVLSGFVLGSSAEAAKLGIVTASDYATSHMGAIEGSYIDSDKISAIKSVITGLNRDPAVYNTVDPITGESSIYIRQYNYSTTNLQNSYAFNGQDWNNKVAGNTSGAVNAHDVARYKDFVYVASYDEGTIGVAQVTDTVISDKTAFTRNLKADLTEFAGITFDSKAQLHGEGVVIIDSSLYVIANCNPQGGYDPYSPSYLIKYGIKEDGRLSYDGYTTMGKNTDSVTLNVYNNYMLATAIGGYQFYGAENSNADTSLNYAELDPVTKRFVRNGNGAIHLPENLLTVRNNQTIPKSEFRSLKVLPNGTAYVMTYNIGRAGKNVDVTVYQTTVSNLLSSSPQNWKEVYHEAAAPGWFGRLDAEYNTKRLWVQVGNKLHIFTDGETGDNHKVYGTGDFAANDMYEELYTWDIISTDIVPDSKLVKLNVVNNVAANDVKTNKKAVKWDNATVTNVNQRLENVSGQVMIENNDKPLIHLDGNVEGNKTNNVLAGIYAEGVNTSVVSNKGLQIQVQNNIASPVGIYAGNGGSVKYYGSSSDLNIITKTMDGGNTLTNAVWLDPSKNGSEAITLQSASTNITMEGGYGGNGVAIQKTDRWGEDSKASTQGGKITITGDLNIKGKDNATWGIEGNPTNVLSRFNNAGILVDVNNSSVTVGGNVDMDVYGNGVTVTGDNSTVTLEKGGSITVPKGTDYGYYALAAYDGTINMNADATANAVKLNGDVFATSEGTINLGLATKDSYLNGIIDNGGNPQNNGAVNVIIKNGATWTNVANNTRYKQDNEDKGSNGRSHVTLLTGGTSFDDAGTIIQKATSDNLYIDTLTGAVKVKYDSCAVDESNVVKVDGGNVTINEATAGSLVGLYTPSAGIDTTDEAEVTAVLNALANKLYYNGYMQRTATLQGYVTIGEGITSSSITNKHAKEITFTEHGQGTTTGEGTGVNPDTGVEDQPGEGGEVEKVIPSGLLNETANTSVSQSTFDWNGEGHGVTVNALGATVSIGSGNITVPKGTEEEKYYAVNALNGRVSMSTGEQYFDNGGDYNIDGDIYVDTAGSAYIGISGSDNYLKGAVVCEGSGFSKLMLKNNATWENVSNNSEKGVTSHIKELGVWSGAKIVQTPDSGDIVIDKFGGNYSHKDALTSPTGNQGHFQGAGDAKVYYTHDEDTPTLIKGGNIVINKACYTIEQINGRRPGLEGLYAEKPRKVTTSKITLCTNYSSNITAENVVNVLNSLANKLYYLGAQYEYDEDGNVKKDANGNLLTEDGNVTVYVYDRSANNYAGAWDIQALSKLNAYVQINEGLTASSVTAEVLTNAGILDADGTVNDGLADKITVSNNSINANVIFNGVTGQGSLTGELKDGTGMYTPSGEGESFIDANGAYNHAIYGNAADDRLWQNAGILSGGVYNFTDAVNVFYTNQKKIDGGAWHIPVGVAISAHGKLYNTENVVKTKVNLNNNDLVITNVTTGSGASITAIDKGIVEISNAGNIVINEQGYGLNAGIFANSGGEVYIDNADGGTVTIRTASGGANNDPMYKEHGAGIKTMNGVSDVRSKVVITGMVDIVADLNTCNNEAISAVASTVDIGGGNIQAINGAWAAIRAYGEFVTENTSVVNVNVVKQMDENGNVKVDPNDPFVELIAGAGDNKTTIYGDFVTNGGMGTRGHISVGLNGKDSYWTGNYADNRGYGVTQGQEGKVSLFMKNGATWTGFNDGEMDVTMEGEGTTWFGYNVAERKPDAMGNVNGGLTLTLKDGAVWQNAITKEQKHNDTVQDAKVYDFKGDGGFIDMTGNKTFIGKNSASHADGSNGVSFKNTSIIYNDTPQETGNLVITNYSGDTTVIYRRNDDNKLAVVGGDTIIKSAAANSQITLSTDNVGLDMTNITQVETVLDNLADKLFYTGYIGKEENNLKGFVQIAEGLTTSSAGKYIGDVVFSETDGQADYKNGSLSKPSTGEDDNENDDNTGNENQGGTTDKEDTTIKVENITGGNIVGDTWADNNAEDNVYKDLVGANKEGEEIIDLGRLDKEGSEVDIVKIETQEDASTGANIGISTAGSTKPVIFEADSKSLSVTSKASGEAKGISATGNDVEINGAGYVTIEATSTNGSASAIYASGKDVTIESSETVKLIATGGTGAVLHAAAGSNVNIDGKVEIVDNKNKVAVEVANGATVNIGGGVIDAGKEGTAIVVTGDDSKVVANTDDKGESKKNGLKIKGNIQIGEVASTFNLKRSIMLLASGNKPSGEFTFDGVEDTWEGDYIGANDATLVLALKNGATWTGAKESNGVLDLTIESNGTWKNTSDKATTVTTLSGEGGFVEMSEGDLAISTYNGKTTFVYANNYGKDVKDEDLIKGGAVEIKAAADGSVATMRTNNIGTSDKDEVERVLKALAKKLAYSGYDGSLQNQKLTGKVQIMEGMTGSSVTREGLIKFDASGNGSLDTSKDVTIDYKGDYIYGDSETAMMKGAKSAMASTVMMWRSESNDLLQRMGDVRLATEESGVWAKYYGGKYEMDAQNTNFSTNYKAYQVGYDKAVGNGWNVGVAVSHNEGDSRYDRGGEGEMTVTSLSVYGNKDYGDGRYLGLILKGSQLKNEYEVFNNDGYKLEGDFKTWGTSISAEYGKRIEKGNGFYFDPSVELTIGHVQGKDYTATSDMLAAYGKTATMQVEQDDFNSIIGRVGFGIGQRTDKASYYAKLALAHEFGGDFDTHYTAEETKGTNIDFGDTWYEMQLGGTAKLSDNSLLYATYERSFGGDVTEKWRVDAGLRVTF